MSCVKVCGVDYECCWGVERYEDGTGCVSVVGVWNGVRVEQEVCECCCSVERYEDGVGCVSVIGVWNGLSVEQDM